MEMEQHRPQNPTVIRYGVYMLQYSIGISQLSRFQVSQFGFELILAIVNRI